MHFERHLALQKAFQNAFQNANYIFPEKKMCAYLTLPKIFGPVTRNTILFYLAYGLLEASDTAAGYISSY